MKLEIRNPATGAVLGVVPADDRGDVDRKVAAAAAAQRRWHARPFRERAEPLRRFGELVTSERERLARLLSQEVGKPIRQARAELTGLGSRLAYFLTRTERAIADECVLASPDLTERISYEPLGVVVNISAWNYPWFVGLNVIAPALLTGNAVLYKPSEHAALTGAEIVALLHRAGVPDDVVVAVQGAGEVGAALLQPPVRGVFFTGSHRTGVKVATAAAPLLARVQLELGGKDPLYAADDVDVAAAARAAAEGACYNAGQSCCAVERIYVHEAIHDGFVEALVAEVKGYKVGDPLDEATDVGPLCREAQVGVLEEQVADAIARGGEVCVGGRRRPGRGSFFEPTVITSASHAMTLMTEESFGPVVGVMAVRSDEEAVARMRDTRYGLTAAVYSRSQRRAEAILRRLPTGSAYWNCCDRVSPRLPWSGRGDSGVGVTLSRAGIRAFVEPRGWHLKSP